MFYDFSFISHCVAVYFGFSSLLELRRRRGSYYLRVGQQQQHKKQFVFLIASYTGEKCLFGLVGVCLSNRLDEMATFGDICDMLDTYGGRDKVSQANCRRFDVHTLIGFRNAYVKCELIAVQIARFLSPAL